MSFDNPRFATTQWTLVWQAAAESVSGCRPALEEIVRRYWMPLYSFARHQGLSVTDAEDATQEFLFRIIEGDLIAKADPAKGKFRTFLLTAWKRFLVDEYRKAHSQKRGGGKQLFTLDPVESEKQFQAALDQSFDADRSFIVGWANSVLDAARNRLVQEYASRGKQTVSDFLLPKLTSPMDNQAYVAASQPLSMSPTAVKVALHRMRQRFGEILREIVAETVDDPAEIDQEITELLSACRHQKLS